MFSFLYLPYFYFLYSPLDESISLIKKNQFRSQAFCLILSTYTNIRVGLPADTQFFVTNVSNVILNRKQDPHSCMPKSETETKKK